MQVHKTVLNSREFLDVVLNIEKWLLPGRRPRMEYVVDEGLCLLLCSLVILIIFSQAYEVVLLSKHFELKIVK